MKALITKIKAWILDFFPHGSLVVVEIHPRNAHLIKAYFKKHRYRAVVCTSYDEVITKLAHKKVLGIWLNHELTDTDKTSQDIVRYIRKENEDLLTLPIFLVASLDTYTLQEYEYLGISQYHDTENANISKVIEEIIPYLLERD